MAEFSLNDSEEFEIVPPAHESRVGSLPQNGIAASDEEHGENSIIHSHPDADVEEIDGDHGSLLQSIDPHEAFVVVQRDQELIRNQLLETQSIFKSQLQRFQEQQEKKSAEIKHLRSQNETFQCELDERDRRINDLTEQVKKLFEFGKQVDEVTARNMHYEELLKQKEAFIRNIQSEGGFVHVQPPQEDSILVNEISFKDAKIQQLEQKLNELEDQLAQAIDQEDQWRKETDELRNLNVALQQQVELDRVDIHDIRVRHEEHIEALRREIRALKGQTPDRNGAGSFGSDGEPQTLTLQYSGHQNQAQQHRCEICCDTFNNGAELANHMNNRLCRLIQQMDNID